ncbi:SDR family NAD(P)-dependent oxidoreductase [Rhodococcus triatomae]
MASTVGGASILLTGATSGMGLSMARMLTATPDWTVIATARSQARADELRALLADPGNFRYVVCDQADLAGVREAGRRIVALLADPAVAPLRAVVLNAGIQTGSTAAATVDGFEPTFGTNLIGPHLLLGAISAVLTAPVRVVAVGSGTHYGKFRRSYGMVPAPRWETPEELASPREGDGTRAYATSKLGTLYWVHELARRAPRGIDAICFDPGMMPGTGLARNRGAIQRFGWNHLLPAMNVLAGVSTPARSAAHLLALATGTSRIPDATLRGSYVELDRLVPSSAESHDASRELELFEFLDTAAGLGTEQVADWWPRSARGIS